MEVTIRGEGKISLNGRTISSRSYIRVHGYSGRIYATLSSEAAPNVPFEEKVTLVDDYVDIVCKECTLHKDITLLECDGVIDARIEYQHFLEQLELRGTGVMRLRQSTFKYVHVELHGAGLIEFNNLFIDDVVAIVRGNGSITGFTATKTSRAIIKGAGCIEGRALPTANLYESLDGAGKIAISRTP